MTLTAQDVAEITRMLEDSSFDELYLELDGLKLTLRRNGAATQPAIASPTPEAAPAPASAPPSTPSAGAADTSAQDVAAPLLGTFYRAPKPGAAPFVEVGSTVEKDTVVGIIEVMKLMNAVRAGVRGTVREILAQDGTLVEYGQVLLRVDTTGQT